MPDKKPPVDVFEYTNKLDSVKKELHVELFLFNKNFTPYATRISDVVSEQIKTLFVSEFINEIQIGAGTGLSVRDIDFQSDNTNVLVREDLSKVHHANNLVHFIENDRDDIVYFSEAEHEFRRMKGLMVRVTHATDRDLKFYVVRMLEASKVVTENGWQVADDLIDVLQPPVAFKFPTDNQTVIIGDDIFTFNQSKFEKTFNYDYVRLIQADNKAKDFVKKFKISVASDVGNDLGNILRENTSLLNKFLKTDIELMNQETVIELADTMQLELMTDDQGAIIILDKQDLSVLLDIMNDNYFESPATGNHYVAKTKKAIVVAEG
ncbi:MAG: DUF4868 domain-containing protein [Flavobacteriales bacterium]|nr:DUF4868 domain-containing protein [Flavobacteriales bacterium]